MAEQELIELQWPSADSKGVGVIAVVERDGMRRNVEVPEHVLASIDKVVDRFKDELIHKYIKGYIEHGGKLEEKGMDYLLRAIEEEAIDQVVYAFALRTSLERYGATSQE